MNKNRARTRRRLAARRTPVFVLGNGLEARSARTPRDVVKHEQRLTDVKHRRATPFEVQVRDKSGRWRKAAGVARTATWGLADRYARRVDADAVRVRNTETGHTVSVVQ